LLYLFFLEASSWLTSTWPGPCIIETEHNKQSGDHYDHQEDCPTLSIAALILLERLDRFIERHDKSIVAGFTVVLALSTIGLWLATTRLWQATINADLARARDTEILERAYLSVDALGVGWPTTTGSPSCVSAVS
jgi:hypothetical protein